MCGKNAVVYHRSQILLRAAHLLAGVACRMVVCDHKVGDVYVVALVDAAAAVGAASADEWLSATAAHLRSLPVTDHSRAGAAVRMVPPPCVLRPAGSRAMDSTPGRFIDRAGPPLWLHGSELLTSRHLLWWPERHEKPSLPSGRLLPIPNVSLKARMSNGTCVIGACSG